MRTMIGRIVLFQQPMIDKSIELSQTHLSSAQNCVARRRETDHFKWINRLCRQAISSDWLTWEGNCRLTRIDDWLAAFPPSVCHSISSLKRSLLVECLFSGRSLAEWEYVALRPLPEKSNHRPTAQNIGPFYFPLVAAESRFGSRWRENELLSKLCGKVFLWEECHNRHKQQQNLFIQR